MRISLLCLICLLPLFCESKSIEDVVDTKLGVSEKVLVAEAKTAKKNENENKLARVDSVTSSSDPGDPAPSESSTAGSTPSESSTAGSTPSESSTADSAPSESSTADSAPSESSTAGSTPSESSTADSTPSESSTAGSTPSESSTAGSTPSESSTAGSQDRKPTSTTTTAATTTTTSPAPRPQGLTQEKFFDQAVKRLLDRFSEEGDAIQVTLTQDVLKHISSSNLALRTNKDVYSFQEKNNPEIQEKLLKQLPREENIPTNKQNVYLKSVLNHYRTASSAKRGKREAGNAIIQGTHIIDDMKITNIAYDSIRNVPRVLIGVKCTIGPITFKPADAPSQDPIVYFNLTDEFNVEIKERSPGSYRLRILNHDVDVFMSKSITINKTGLDSKDRRTIRRELYDVVMSLDLESKFYSDLRRSLATVEVADGFTYDSRFTPQTVVALRRNDFSE